MNKDNPVTKIKIRAYGVQADYLRSTPLHKSPAEVQSKHGEFAEFTYRLCETPELINQLLAMGDKVEIMEPETLREKIKDNLHESLARYEKTHLHDDFMRLYESLCAEETENNKKQNENQISTNGLWAEKSCIEICDM